MIWKNNNYAFRKACERGHIDVVKYLFDQSSNINDQHYNSINFASSNGHLQVVKFLIEKEFIDIIITYI